MSRLPLTWALCVLAPSAWLCVLVARASRAPCHPLSRPLRTLPPSAHPPSPHPHRSPLQVIPLGYATAARITDDSAVTPFDMAMISGDLSVSAAAQRWSA